MTAGTVFLVDDDPSVRRAVTRLLQANGIAMVAASSVTEFLAIESIRRPMCIVADIQMPDRSGFELIDSIRRDGHTWPVILVTGYADKGIYRRSAQAGVVALLVKPVEERELLDAIAEGWRRDRFGSELGERQRDRKGGHG
jgi:FixJ family two-component response regulator